MRLSRLMPLAFTAIAVAACAGGGAAAPDAPDAPGASTAAAAPASAAPPSAAPSVSPADAPATSASPSAAAPSVPPRDPPAYTTGTASIRLTGGNKGAETLEFAVDLLPGGPAALPYATLTWLGRTSQSGTARASFRLFTVTPHETGDLSAKDGTLGIEMVFIDPKLGDVQNGLDAVFQEGLGEEPNPFGDPDAPGPSCTATIAPTPTGGISGTFKCPNISDSGQLVVKAEGEFTAEY